MRVVTCLFTEHNLWFVLLAAARCVVGTLVTVSLHRLVARSQVDRLGTRIEVGGEKAGSFMPAAARPGKRA
jgi:NO-binding membrane sensor protein with MHYT domain